MKSESFAPPPPVTPESFAGEESAFVRYEHVSQDGRLRLEAVWLPVGRLLWATRALSDVLHRLRAEHSISNVLANISMGATEARVAPRERVRHVLRYRFERTRRDDGTVNRVLFTTWLRTERDGPDGPEVLASAYGQRVLTRLSGGEHRRITDLPEPSIEPSGLADATFPTLDRVLSLPRGAVPLDPAPRVEPSPVVFGLSHTDSNQHVNFLVYPRVFEEAALHRFVDLGRSTRVMARHVDIVYRRPSHAGDVVSVAGQTFSCDGRVGMLLALLGPRSEPHTAVARGGASASGFEALGTVRCAARMWFA